MNRELGIGMDSLNMAVAIEEVSDGDDAFADEGHDRGIRFVADRKVKLAVLPSNRPSHESLEGKVLDNIPGRRPGGDDSLLGDSEAHEFLFGSPDTLEERVPVDSLGIL